MGWNAGAYIFNPVADALIETNASYNIRYVVCKALIDALQECDWDTEDESLNEYAADSAIVNAFKDCGIDLIPYLEE